MAYAKLQVTAPITCPKLGRVGETMTIELSPEQERAIQEAIKSGFVRSVDEFIDVAIAMLPQSKDHTESSRQAAVRRMEEFAEEYHLSLGEPITRKLLHEGHRY